MSSGYRGIPGKNRQICGPPVSRQNSNNYKKTISANTFEKDKTSLIDHYAMCNETWKLNVKEISSVTPAYILDSCDISFNMCVFAPFCSVCGNSKHEKRTKLEI